IARSRPNVPRTGRDSQETEPRRFCSSDPGDPGTPAPGTLGPMDSAFDPRNPVKEAWGLARLHSRRKVTYSQVRNATRGRIGRNGERGRGGEDEGEGGGDAERGVHPAGGAARARRPPGGARGGNEADGPQDEEHPHHHGGGGPVSRPPHQPGVAEDAIAEDDR